MTIEYTIRFASTDAIERTIGCVLLNSEADTIGRLIGGYYFRSQRNPLDMIAAFAEEGFEVEDFASFEFAPK